MLMKKTLFYQRGNRNATEYIQNVTYWGVVFISVIHHTGKTLTMKSRFKDSHDVHDKLSTANRVYIYERQWYRDFPFCLRPHKSQKRQTKWFGEKIKLRQNIPSISGGILFFFFWRGGMFQLRSWQSSNIKTTIWLYVVKDKSWFLYIQTHEHKYTKHRKTKQANTTGFYCLCYRLHKILKRCFRW